MMRRLMLALMILMLSLVDAVAQGAPAGPAVEGQWVPHIRSVDEALAAKNVSAAERAWYQACTAALGSQTWESMIAVGDAALRVGELEQARGAAVARARRAYLNALFRARHVESLDGVLRAAGAFAALGDRGIVAQCLHVARGLARDAAASARIRAFEERWSEHSAVAR